MPRHRQLIATWCVVLCGVCIQVPVANADAPPACGAEDQKPCTVAPATLVGKKLSSCPPGSHYSVTNGGSCWRCPEGSNRTAGLANGLNACIKPASDDYKPADKHGAAAGPFKGRCPAGQSAANGWCYSCPSGYSRKLMRALDGGEACVARLPAVPSPAEEIASLSCPGGSVYDAIDGGTCWSCPSGYSRTLRSVKHAEACAAPLFSGLSAGKCNEGLTNQRNICKPPSPTAITPATNAPETSSDDSPTQTATSLVHDPNSRDPNDWKIIDIGTSKKTPGVTVWYENGAVTTGSSVEFELWQKRRLFRRTTGIYSPVYRDIVGIAIAPDDKVYAWFSNGTFSVGNADNLDAYVKPAAYRLPTDHWPNNIVAMGISPKTGHVYTYYNDGKYSVGTFNDLAAHDGRKLTTYTLLPGKTPIDIAGIDISTSVDTGADVVYVWYHDGTLSSGTSAAPHTDNRFWPYTRTARAYDIRSCTGGSTAYNAFTCIELRNDSFFGLQLDGPWEQYYCENSQCGRAEREYGYINNAAGVTDVVSGQDIPLLWIRNDQRHFERRWRRKITIEGKTRYIQVRVKRGETHVAIDDLGWTQRETYNSAFPPGAHLTQTPEATRIQIAPDRYRSAYRQGAGPDVSVASMRFTVFQGTMSDPESVIIPPVYLDAAQLETFQKATETGGRAISEWIGMIETNANRVKNLGESSAHNEHIETARRLFGAVVGASVSTGPGLLVALAVTAIVVPSLAASKKVTATVFVANNSSRPMRIGDSIPGSQYGNLGQARQIGGPPGGIIPPRTADGRVAVAMFMFDKQPGMHGAMGALAFASEGGRPTLNVGYASPFASVRTRYNRCGIDLEGNLETFYRNEIQPADTSKEAGPQSQTKRRNGFVASCGVDAQDAKGAPFPKMVVYIGRDPNQ